MRLLQASDMHLDAPFATLDDELAKLRRREQMATFQRLIEVAGEERPDALLLPGDLFEHRSTRLGTVSWAMDLLGSLAPMPVLIAPGNHDPWQAVSFWSLERPANVLVFADNWQMTEVAGARIWGRGFGREHEPGDPLADFPPAERADLLVFHGDLDKAGAESDYAPFSRARLAEIGAIWTAVGHIHKPTAIGDLGAYAGSLEPLGFDEPGQHGALMVELDLQTRKKQWHYLPLARARYETVVLDLAGRGDEEALAEFRSRSLDWPMADTLVRVELVGMGADTAWPASRWQGELGNGWRLAEVRDLRLMASDPSDQFTVRGRFAHRLLAELAGAEASQRQVFADALRIGLAALEGRRGGDY